MNLLNLNVESPPLSSQNVHDKRAVPCRVMAQVSCELVAPKESRPNEGILFFNIELSPMASPAFEAGR